MCWQKPSVNFKRFPSTSFREAIVYYVIYHQSKTYHFISLVCSHLYLFGIFLLSTLFVEIQSVPDVIRHEWFLPSCIAFIFYSYDCFLARHSLILAFAYFFVLLTTLYFAIVTKTWAFEWFFYDQITDPQPCEVVVIIGSAIIGYSYFLLTLTSYFLEDFEPPCLDLMYALIAFPFLSFAATFVIFDCSTSELENTFEEIEQIHENTMNEKLVRERRESETTHDTILSVQNVTAISQRSSRPSTEDLPGLITQPGIDPVNEIRRKKKKKKKGRLKPRGDYINSPSHGFSRPHADNFLDFHNKSPSFGSFNRSRERLHDDDDFVPRRKKIRKKTKSYSRH